MAANQLCFVLMPYNRKQDESGRYIDFDRVYSELIAPAVRNAGLEPLRADEELDQGIIHKAMFERLLLCDYAVADVTLANANVFYELGIRHAARPLTTILIAADQRPLPFDVAMLRVVPYRLSTTGEPVAVNEDCGRLTARLREARNADSPIYQLVDGFEGPQLHELAAYQPEYLRQSIGVRNRISACPSAEELRFLEPEIGSGTGFDVESLLTLLSAYRRYEAWGDIIRLVADVPAPLGSLRVVHERLAFALNRSGSHAEAERLLEDLHARHGATSESLGLCGRIYKDRWLEADGLGNTLAADGYLQRAIDTYRAGFAMDSRDWYPGVNAVTLLCVQGHDYGVDELLPIVRFALENDIARGNDDYWAHATRLELDVVAASATMPRHLATALAREPEVWQLRSTLDNLRLLLRSNRAPDWLAPLVAQLEELTDESHPQ